MRTASLARGVSAGILFTMAKASRRRCRAFESTNTAAKSKNSSMNPAVLPPIVTTNSKRSMNSGASTQMSNSSRRRAFTPSNDKAISFSASSIDTAPAIAEMAVISEVRKASVLL